MRLHPFRALHPTREAAARVASPPYDVVSSEEAAALAEGNPDSFLHVVRPEIDLPVGTDVHSDAVYAMAGKNLRRLRDTGVMVQDAEPALWLYRLEMGGHVQMGFVGCAEVQDYAAGRIKRHEFTRRDKEDDRTRHVNETGANAGPVFLSCRAHASLTELQQRLTGGPADLDVTRPGPPPVRHTLWAVRDAAALAEVAAAFAALDAFYIADGHHRAASAGRTRDLRRAANPGAPVDVAWERFLVVVFPEDQLQILPYNRVVHDLAGRDADAFLAAASAAFEIGPPGAAPEPPARHSFGLYLDGQWRRMTARPAAVDEGDPVKQLDVAILQDRLLGPVLGIDDPRTDDRISFVGGIRGTAELAKRVDAQGGGCAIAMFPTAMGELLAVADAGEVMPPKSTWFEPKLASGLVVHLLDG
jgi:uncharacterized protein (DUF1015 family)